MYNQFLTKTYSVDLIENFHDIIYKSSQKYGKKTAFLQKDSSGKTTKEITYNQLKKDFDVLCDNMLKMGLKDSTIGIIGRNSYEWAITYICAATIGVAVPLDKELHTDSHINFITKAKCNVVYADNKYIKGLSGLLPDTAFIPLEENIVEKISLPQQDRMSGSIDNSRMCSIIFTSGTTGKEKGVCLSQKNICSNIMSTAKMVRVTSDAQMLSVLPLHHTYESTLGLMMPLYCGATISYSTSLKTFAKELPIYNPTILIGVPLLLEHMVKKIKKTLIDSCPAKYKQIFIDNDLKTGLSKMPFLLRYIIKNKIKKSLGSKLELCIVGAASMDPVVSHDLMAIGIRVLEGYGLTECSPLLAGNNDFYNNIGSVGFPIPDVEIEIHNPNDEGIGEIIAKGDNIMLGYFEDEQSTKQYIKNGYFYTGDLGCIDDKGFLTIKGRIKNVIVTSNGKNIYPEELESVINNYDFVREVIIYEAKSQKKSIVKAKILPDFDKLKEQFGKIPTHNKIYDLIGKLIDDFNAKVPSYKKISMYEILSSELEKTTSQKIKRYGVNII